MIGRDSLTLRILLRVVASGPAIILLVTVIIFSALTPYFFTVGNLTNIVTQSLVTATLALGILVVMIVGELDISIAATVGLATVIGAMLYRDNPSLGFWIPIIMVLVGLLAGVVNAILVVGFRFGNSFIVTLGTQYAFQSLAFVLAGGQQIPGMPPFILAVANDAIAGIPYAVILVVVCAVILAVLLRKVVWGRWIFAVGGNQSAAGRVGIPARWVVASTFILAGLAASIAAILVAGRANAGYAQTGTSVLFAIAAVVIGGASIFGGRGTVIGTLIGALVLGAVQNGLGLLAINPNWVTFAIGAILVAAVGLDYLRTRVETLLRARLAQLAMGAR